MWWSCDNLVTYLQAQFHSKEPLSCPEYSTVESFRLESHSRSNDHPTWCYTSVLQSHFYIFIPPISIITYSNPLTTYPGVEWYCSNKVHMLETTQTLVPWYMPQSTGDKKVKLSLSLSLSLSHTHTHTHTANICWLGSFPHCGLDQTKLKTPRQPRWLPSSGKTPGQCGCPTQYQEMA